MTKTIKKFNFLICLLVVILNTPAAVAQNHSKVVLEEVIVTANKRAESLQEISASVLALSDELLRDANIVDYYDIANMTPGMTQQTETNVTIRGIGRSDSGTGFGSAVATHENGFFLPNPPLWPILDLHAVEVTRGPSGTVFGRNATAGAIDMKWNAPESEQHISIDHTSGSYNLNRTRMMLNVPILGDDILNSRWAFTKQKRDGYTENSLAEDDRDGESKDEWLWRVFLQSNLGEDLLLSVRYMHWYRDNFQYYGIPDAETRSSGLYEQVGTTRPPEELFRIQSNLVDKNGGRPGWTRVRRFDFDLQWSLTDLPLLGDIDVNLLYGSNQQRGRLLVDFDGSEADIVYFSSEEQDGVRSGELRFSSMSEPSDSGLDWMLGMFWARFHDNEGPADTLALLPIPAGQFAPAGAGPLVNLLGDIETVDSDVIIRHEAQTFAYDRDFESEAVYANFQLHLRKYFPSFADIVLFGGYRINRDFNELFLSNSSKTFIPSDAPEAAVTGGGVTRGDASFREDTWEIGSKWFANDDHMAYAKLARGYKAGGVEQGALGSTFVNSVDPEILFAVEVGSKSSFLEGALNINMAIYWYEYTDLQVLFREFQNNRTENAASAELKGLELDFTWQATSRLLLRAGLAIAKAEFKEFCTTDSALPQGFTDPECEGKGGEENVAGNRLPNASDFSAMLVMQYEIDMGEFGSLHPMLRSNYSSKIFAQPSNRERYEIEGYFKTDFHMLWKSPSEKWSIDGFVQHIEDDQNQFFTPVAIGLEGLIFNVSHRPPMMWGLELRYSI